MISYAEREVFFSVEISLHYRAQKLIEIVEHDIAGGELRCHELARAVGTVLGLVVADGWYGMVEHSWLWTLAPEPLDPNHPNMFVPPNILDVYAVGRLPQVQLVHSSTVLPYEYRRGDARSDVREDVVALLLDRFAWTPPKEKEHGREKGTHSAR